MILIDIIILALLLWGGFKGAKNGAVMEAVRLFAIFFATRLATFVGGVLNLESQYAGSIYFIILVIAVVGMLFLAGYIVTKFVKIIMLGWLNSLLGVIFGLAKTILILSLLIFYFGKIDDEKRTLSEESRESSLLFRPLEKVAPAVMPSLLELWERVRE